MPRRCHSRFCNSCGIKYAKKLAAKASSFCLNTVHRHIVFTIPQELRNWFLQDRSRLAYELKKYAKVAGVKRIRVHDLRHSHASLLIEQGIQPNIVQDRLGHEKIETTLNTYSHLYPNKQYHLADFLDHIATNNNNKLPITSEPVVDHEALMIQTTK